MKRTVGMLLTIGMLFNTGINAETEKTQPLKISKVPQVEKSSISQNEAIEKEQKMLTEEIPKEIETTKEMPKEEIPKEEITIEEIQAKIDELSIKIENQKQAAIKEEVERTKEVEEVQIEKEEVQVANNEDIQPLNEETIEFETEQEIQLLDTKVINTNSQLSETKKSENEGTIKDNTTNNKKPEVEEQKDTKGRRVVKVAKQQLGKPYVWGATGPSSFDCSGLTSYVYKQSLNKTLPRTSREQSKVGKTVSKSNLQEGDLIFFGSSSSNINHVGLYIGDSKMIHSPKPGDVVRIDSINSSYYAKRFVTAKRVI